MANFSKRPNGKSLHLVSDILFEGALLSDTRAVLVAELISYILYERQQMPLPAEQLKLRIDASSTANENGADLNFKKQVRNVAEQKAKSFLEDLKQICDNLKRSFRSCPEIDQVAILLGGTVVSPRESYIIKFPPTCPDADCLPLTVCKNKLFRQIISEDVVGSLKTTLPPSNIMVLLSAPRSCPLTWFLPKHSISPLKGTTVSFNFQCLYLVPICHDLSKSEYDTVDLSGLEALECSVCDSDGEHSSDSAIFNSVIGEPSENKDIQRDSSSNHCKRTSCNSLPKHVNGSNKTKLERFCKHQKLNYIFTSHKKGRIPVINSPEGFHSVSFACHMSSSTPCIQGFKDNSSDFHPNLGVPIPAEQNDATLTGRTMCDYIWYQSPLVLKGFRDPQDSSQTLKFV